MLYWQYDVRSFWNRFWYYLVGNRTDDIKIEVLTTQMHIRCQLRSLSFQGLVWIFIFSWPLNFLCVKTYTISTSRGQYLNFEGSLSHSSTIFHSNRYSSSKATWNEKFTHYLPTWPAAGLNTVAVRHLWLALESVALSTDSTESCAPCIFTLPDELSQKR